MKTQKKIGLNIILIFSLSLISFTIGDSKSEYNIPISPISIFTSDIDLDSDVDIVTGHVVNWGHTNKSMSVLMNFNNGLFTISDTMKSFCGSQKSIVTARINEDSLPDIVTFYADISSGNPIRFIRIYYNDNGSFNNYLDFNLNNSSSFQGSYFADINGDNYHEVVVISYSEEYWGFLLNDGQGNLSSPTYYNLNYSPTHIKSGALNEDNYDDIVIGGADLMIKFSQGTNFQTLSFDDGAVDVEITDLDNDGDNDIIGYDDLYYGTQVRFYENQGNNNFLKHEDWSFTPGCYYMIVSDFNNDSLPDLFFHTNADNGMYFYYNLGGFEFGSPEYFPFTNYGEYFRRSCSADFDNNGYNDLVIVRSSGALLPVGNVTILFNDGNGNFSEDPVTNNQSSNNELQTTSLTCYPNPFNYETTISFTAQENEKVRLQVYDLKGNLINTLNNKIVQYGKYNVKWNGTDKNGKEVKTGVYIIQLVTGSQNHSCRIIYNK